MNITKINSQLSCHSRDRSITRELVARVESEGYKALVLTVDTPIFGCRRADIRNKFKLHPHLRSVYVVLLYQMYWEYRRSTAFFLKWFSPLMLKNAPM